MKNGKVLLIDVDDTIEYLLQSWLQTLNDKHGTNVQYNEITDWDVAKFFPTLTREQVFEPIHSNEFWKTVKPRLDAMKYVKKLFDEGYEIYLCTSTDYRNIQAKYEYIIQRYFPYIQWNHVIVAYQKQMIKADYLIDDGVHNLENGDFTKILITAPHNRSYDATANGMYRANDWEDVYNIISHGGRNERY